MNEPRLHIVLHQPEIPQNTGNIGRTCVAVGAKLWLVEPLAFRLDEKHRRRAGLDYWEYLDWEVVADWPTLLQRIPQRKPWLFSTRGTRPYHTASFQGGDVLVFGGESQGLPQSILQANDERVLRIPVREQVRSLNLANSVAVAAYEWLRQCSEGPT